MKMQIHILKKERKKASYLDELAMVKREESEQLKHHPGIFREKRKYDSSIFVIFFLIMLVAIVVTVAMYSVYLLVRVSGISNMAGVHVTPAIQKASQEINKELYEEEELQGYDDWKSYHNVFFQFMYPNDMELRENGEISLRKYNDQEMQHFDSLAMAVTFGELENPQELPAKELITKNRRNFGKAPVETEACGKPAILTGKLFLSSGLEAEAIYWPLYKKIFYMETVYYEKDITDLEKINKKIMDSIKFN